MPDHGDKPNSRPTSRPLFNAEYAPLAEDPVLAEALATGFGNTASTGDAEEPVGQQKKKHYIRALVLGCLLAFAIAVTLALVLEPRSRYGLSFGWSKMWGVHKPQVPPQKLSNITYDNRAVIINGKRQLLISGAIHYPRSTPGMWPVLLKQSKEAGINIIDTYVFWNLHEPKKGEWDFETGESALQSEAGLYVNLRLGPYVCAEWNYGGLPVWLRDETGLEIRTWNQPWMNEMERFTRKIIDIVNPFLASHGGNIIMMQIENEYGNVEWEYGASGDRYIMWAADLANSLDTGIPWIMCLNDDVPTVITTCNGFYCDNWIGKHKIIKPKEPHMFTELWSGWFQFWKDAKPTRPAEDLAFSVARWVARGGTYLSYYMWHGGTNFARTGADFQTTSYDYDSPMTEYGFPAVPKFNHMQRLHKVLNENSDIILSNEANYYSPGWGKEVHIYGDIDRDSKAIVFFSNYREQNDATFDFGGRSYIVPKWTVQVLKKNAQGSLEVLYSTSDINAEDKKTVPNQMPKSSPYRYRVAGSNASISWIQEPIDPVDPKHDIDSHKPVEQLSLTKDTTDYLWYFRSNILMDLDDAKPVTITLKSVTDDWYVWLDNVPSSPNGASVSTALGKSFELSFIIPASDLNTVKHETKHNLTILSSVIGLKNYGARYDHIVKGLNSRVYVNGQDVTEGDWIQEIGTQGESNQYFDPQSQNIWNTASVPMFKQLVWYRVIIPSKDIDSLVSSIQPTPSFISFALNLSSMGKGEAWVNGKGIGRYWDVLSEGDCKLCDYNGSFKEHKCETKCGEPSQSYYHVPADWLLDSSGQPQDVHIVLFEEQGGEPFKIELVALA